MHYTLQDVQCEMVNMTNLSIYEHTGVKVCNVKRVNKRAGHCKLTVN